MRSEPTGPASLRRRFRQRRFPPEFRIPPDYAPPERPPSRAEAAEATAPVDGQRRLGAQPDQGGQSHLPDAVLADLATQLWRLGRKLAEGGENPSGTGAPGRQPRAARHVRAAQDSLTKAGVETQDHDGMKFDIGLALDVLAYQPSPLATHETVQETVRPSVYRDGRCIQSGQVIVAQPEGNNDHGS